MAVKLQLVITRTILKSLTCTGNCNLVLKYCIKSCVCKWVFINRLNY